MPDQRRTARSYTRVGSGPLAKKCSGAQKERPYAASDPGGARKTEKPYAASDPSGARETKRPRTLCADREH